MASVFLRQSTSVRWSSLINSLQKLYSAYKVTRKALKEVQQAYIHRIRRFEMVDSFPIIISSDYRRSSNI